MTSVYLFNLGLVDIHPLLPILGFMSVVQIAVSGLYCGTLRSGQRSALSVLPGLNGIVLTSPNKTKTKEVSVSE